jgi:hypothetical protein
MNNQNLERIAHLPDTMSCEVLENEFQKLLPVIKHVDIKSDELLLEAYSELSERQWHTYKPLNADILNQIDLQLISLWNKFSIESTELLIGIVARLGLIKTFERIKETLNEELPEEVRQEILESIEEFGNTVSDPYSGVRLDR